MKMPAITPEVVTYVAALARLQLEPQALAQFVTQLDEILQYVQQLRAISTDEVEPTSHVLPLTNVLRRDERQPCLSSDAVLALAPVAQRPFVTVPKVLET